MLLWKDRVENTKGDMDNSQKVILRLSSQPGSFKNFEECINCCNTASAVPKSIFNMNHSILNFCSKRNFWI